MGNHTKAAQGNGKALNAGGKENKQQSSRIDRLVCTQRKRKKEIKGRN